MVGISLMVMYEDDSVEVRYSDRSCLQLSPCGSEFVLEKALPSSAHPLESSDKIRQRTRFVTSIYKERMIQTLEFRNRFATRPYLAEELIPADCRMHISIDISEVEWPAPGSCGLEFGSNGEAIVSSVDGNASLLLSPSREEFSVEFLCRVSQDPEKRAVSEHVDRQNIPAKAPSNVQLTIAEVARTSGAEANRKMCVGPDIRQSNACAGSPETQPKRARLCTRVVQQHSRSRPPPLWRHPLSLALSRWSTEGAEPSEDDAREGARVAEGHGGHPPPPRVPRGRRCRLPEVLPLRCPSPHQHSWNFRDSLQRSEQNPEDGLRTELVKVLWYEGIVYRLINGAVTIIEISPGDGSLIKSNGAVANYFTHHMPRLVPGQGEERTYSVNSLPPDLPGQAYSVSAVVTRASRLLKCYNQARLSLKLPNTHCCWREENGYSDSSVLIQEAHIPGSGHFMAFSDGRVHVIFLDRATLQMMWNFGRSSPTQETGGASQHLRDPQPLHGWCQLTMPDGQRHLLQLQSPGPHGRYVSTAMQWCRWVEETAQKTDRANFTVQSTGSDQNWSVMAELEKIKRFNFLLEHSGLLRTPGGPAGLSRGSREVVSRGDPSAAVGESSVAEALQRTSRAIQDIETLLSDRMPTHHSAK